MNDHIQYAKVRNHQQITTPILRSLFSYFFTSLFGHSYYYALQNDAKKYLENSLEKSKHLFHESSLAKAEKELGVVSYVYISFEYKDKKGERIRLHSIDIPRSFLDRWQWLINWRHAHLICKYPREKVTIYYSYYDKRSGLETSFGSLLSKLSATKAQVTRVERAIGEYTEFNAQNNMFFDATTDEQLIKANNKLMQKRKNVNKMQQLLHKEVTAHKNSERSVPAWI